MALRNIKSVYDVREELTILENHGCATTVREDERFSHTIRGFSFIDNPNMSDNDAIRKELQNGQIYIYKNVVRYTVLGIETK